MDKLNIVITGASQGVGFEVARQFAALGNNNIVAIARNDENLKKLKNSCIKENIQAHLYPIAFDLNTSESYGNTLIPFIKQNLQHVDILINNAGFLINKDFQSLSDSEMSGMISTNFLSAARLIRDVIPLINPTGGHVVNISSMGGFQGSTKFNGLSVYSASKAAIASLTECLAQEYSGSKISFNCLALGAVDTEMFRKAFPTLNAPKTAEQIANFIVHFAQNGALYFNGKVLPVTNTTP